MGYRGWVGKLLKIDLSSGQVAQEALREELAYDYLGGRGMNVRLLYDETGTRTKALEPDNVLIISAGPFVGTELPTANRGVMTTKSPLSYYAMSLFGGFFAPEMKFAGYDTIVIRGRAKKPSLIWVNNGVVKIDEASDLWGLGTYETEERIRKKYGEKVRTACIGPGGENLVKFASIRVGERTAGRGGVGAVMGSKNLKAVVVRGDLPVKVSDESTLKEIVRGLLKEIREKPPLRPQFADYGTLEAHEIVNGLGILPSRNWQSGVMGHIEEISLENFLKYRIKKHLACYRCPVMCTNTFVINRGEYGGKPTDGPEYETVAAFGGMVALRSPESIIYANQLCNDLGLDTISTGCAIAFGQECFEKGLITKEFAGFEDFSFVNANNDAPLEMIKRIAYRKGEFARLLGEGVKIASERIGRRGEEIAVQVKGLTPGMYDPRGAVGMALIYAISNRGACHHSQGYTVKKEVAENTRFDPTNKGNIVKDLAQYRILVDTLTFCGFLTAHFEWKISPILQAITGRAFSNEELKTISDRINNLERLYLVREGVTRKDDSLPPRFEKEPLPEGVAEGKTVKRADFEKMLDEYYSACGWDGNGIPKDETLKRLNLQR